MYNTIPDSIDFERYLRDTESKNHKMRRPVDFVEATIERMFGDSVGNFARLPFGQVDIQFRPGEVTVWAGVNGHGKSMVISQVMLGFIQQGFRCGVASFELLPEALNKRMILQAAGGIPDVRYVRDFLSWTGDRLWYADVRGSASNKDMLGIVKYAALESKVQHFFIDNLMCCVSGEDDYNSQKDFVFQLCEMARELGIHIHIVHHIRKLQDEKIIPGKFDIKGSGSITDRVDNVIIVYRNKRKEAELQKSDKELPQEKRVEWQRAYDASVIVVKQRDGGEEATVKLWFQREANSFHDRRIDGRPPCFEIPRFVKPELVAVETAVLNEEVES
jgi:twinkle protein